MKPASITLLFALGLCCMSASEKVAPLDGETVVLEGRWNGRAKNAGQLICSTDPKIVEVSDLRGLPSPLHGDFVRVTGVLHWRACPAEEKKTGKMTEAPGTCDCYYLDWPTTKWEKLSQPEDQKKEANQQPQQQRP